MDDSAIFKSTIGDLLVFAGSMMEDECGALILQLPEDISEIASVIERLARVAADLEAIAAAASVVVRRSAERV